MNLHEYQGKELFKKYGLPVNTGIVVESVEQAVAAAEGMAGSKYVVKAQVHAGGRGKAGGVKLVDSIDEVREVAMKLLGSTLVTYQNAPDGQPVNKLMIDEPVDIASELYLGAVIDRATRSITFMASTEGGVEIEKVAEETPELIHKIQINPLVGAQYSDGRKIAFKMGLTAKQAQQFSDIYVKLAKLFVENDLALLEINPLVIKADGDLFCLDAKAVLDSNALYRHPDLKAMEDPSQEDSREREAAKHELNYVALGGNIGCMVNGAGLAILPISWTWAAVLPLRVSPKPLN